MDRFKSEFRIESARLKDWDYRIPWWYYITINTRNHKEWFGRIHKNEIVLNEFGIIANEYWLEIPKHFPFIELDWFVIMPNHLHGIIILNGDSNRRDVACNVSTIPNDKLSEISPKKGSLSVVIRSYKSAVTNKIHSMSNLDFAWQSRFYDRIIRNDKELYKIRKYIDENPLKWQIEKSRPTDIDF